MTPILRIRSSYKDYDVSEADSLDEALTHVTEGENAWLLCDEALLKWHRKTIDRFYPEGRVLCIPVDESAKSLDQLQPVFAWLLDTGFRRDCTLIALGGGVIQDIAGFVASVLFRGARWKLLPSTLLAQCDSCIGSKSSINVLHYKNQLGTFYPPLEVVVVPELLKTLDNVDVRSGLGEIIKLHLVAGEEQFQELKQGLDAEFKDGRSANGDEVAVLGRLAGRALRIKQNFIETDEFDTGIRNLLNYGHTFGHAYETATDYAIPHGIAVTLGIATATRFSANLAMVGSSYADELVEWLRPYYDPYQEYLRQDAVPVILEAMKRDKKNIGQQITCILTRGAGAMEKTVLPVSQVEEFMEDCILELSRTP